MYHIDKIKIFMLPGFGFSDKPQPKYGFDYTLDGKHFRTHLCSIFYQ